MKFVFDPKDISIVLDRLTGNPFLTSLFLLSPPDALEYLGAKWLAPVFAGMRATTPEDKQNVQRIVQALQEGRTTLPPVTVQPDNEFLQDILKTPPEPGVTQVPTATDLTPTTRPDDDTDVATYEPPTTTDPTPITSVADLRADMSFILNKATLQFALSRCREQYFDGQEFHLQPTKWLEAHMRVLNMTLDLVPGAVKVVANIHGRFEVSAFKMKVHTIQTPITLMAQSGLVMNQAGQLCVDVRSSSIQITDTTLPIKWTNELVAKIVALTPSLPLINIPTMMIFPYQEGRGGEMMLMISNVLIREQSVQLDFQLFDGPRAV